MPFLQFLQHFTSKVLPIQKRCVLRMLPLLMTVSQENRLKRNIKLVQLIERIKYNSTKYHCKRSVSDTIITKTLENLTISDFEEVALFFTIFYIVILLANFTTVGTLTFDSISLTDITDVRRISRCKAKNPSSARNFQINPIPSNIFQFSNFISFAY